MTHPTPLPGVVAQSGARIEWLDVLRGVSALLIVLFHVRVNLWVGWAAIRASPESYSAFDRLVAWLSAPTPFFGHAVMLFFIVSGFAIHISYDPTATAALRNYAVRRALRIYPPYLVALLFTLAVQQYVGSLGSSPASSGSQVLHSALMIQNYGAGQPWGNPSLWSLPVEVEFYLIYPLLYLLWRRLGTRPTAMVVAGASAIATIALLGGYQWPLGNFLKYWIIWSSGALLAEWVRAGQIPPWRRGKTFLLALGVLAAVASTMIPLSMGLQHFVWAAVYFLLALWGFTRRDPLSRVAAPLKRFGLFLGRISYSLYLIHFPLFVLCGAIWTSVFGVKPTNFLITLGFALAALAPAYLLYCLVELPSQRAARALTGATGGPTPALGPRFQRSES